MVATEVEREVAGMAEVMVVVLAGGWAERARKVAVARIQGRVQAAEVVVGSAVGGRVVAKEAVKEVVRVAERVAAKVAARAAVTAAVALAAVAWVREGCSIRGSCYSRVCSQSTRKSLRRLPPLPESSSGRRWCLGTCCRT